MDFVSFFNLTLYFEIIMYNKIIIAAANGYLGQVLVNYYAPKARTVIGLVRKPLLAQHKNVQYLLWDGKTLGKWANEFKEADAVINLAGKSVNCRYNEKNKKEIFDSRTYATTIIGEAIKQSATPPKIWINTASATIYRHAMDRPMDEQTGEIGSGFSVEVCKKWEKTFNEIEVPHTRKIILRLAIALGGTEGVMLRLLNLVKFGLGGHQGSGKQMFSWIHDEDFAQITEFCITHKEINGTYNCSAPHPVTNQHLMKTIRKNLHVPIGLPTPSWLLELGAILIGTETELVLKSRWVVPRKLLEAGYTFKYKTIEEAVKKIVTK